MGQLATAAAAAALAGVAVPWHWPGCGAKDPPGLAWLRASIAEPLCAPLAVACGPHTGVHPWTTNQGRALAQQVVGWVVAVTGEATASQAMASSVEKILLATRGSTHVHSAAQRAWPLA